MTPQQLVNLAPTRFDYLVGVGSGGCTDYDAVFERHGHFLIIENKTPGEEMRLGQLIAFRAEVARSSTVLVVHGYPPADIHSWGYLDGPQYPATFDSIRAVVQEWWDSH